MNDVCCSALSHSCIYISPGRSGWYDVRFYDVNLVQYHWPYPNTWWPLITSSSGVIRSGSLHCLVCFWQHRHASQLESAIVIETFYLVCQYDLAACTWWSNITNKKCHHHLYFTYHPDGPHASARILARLVSCRIASRASLPYMVMLRNIFNSFVSNYMHQSSQTCTQRTNLFNVSSSGSPLWPQTKLLLWLYLHFRTIARSFAAVSCSGSKSITLCFFLSSPWLPSMSSLLASRLTSTNWLWPVGWHVSPPLATAIPQSNLCTTSSAYMYKGRDGLMHDLINNEYT